MVSPYRTNELTQEEYSEIDLTDVKATVIYLDVDGHTIKAEVDFIQTILTDKYNYGKRSGGYSLYWEFLSQPATYSGYQVGDIFIPLHRVLLITRTETHRKEKILKRD